MLSTKYEKKFIPDMYYVNFGDKYLNLSYYHTNKLY